MDDGLFSYHLPNLFMAMGMYTLLGRFVLSLLFQPGSQAAFWVAFRRISDPLIAPFAVITPRAVPAPLLPLVGFVWLFLLRVVFFLTAYMYGFAPKVGA